MKINCVSCGFKVDLGDAYDNYEGQVKCYACGGTLNIRTEEGDVLGVAIARPTIEIDIVETLVREARPVGALVRESDVSKAKPVNAPTAKSVVHHVKPDGVGPHI